MHYEYRMICRYYTILCYIFIYNIGVYSVLRNGYYNALCSLTFRDAYTSSRQGEVNVIVTADRYLYRRFLSYYLSYIIGYALYGIYNAL